MPRKKIDKETLDFINSGEKLKEVINSDAWKLVKELIDENLKDLESIRHVTGKTAEDRDIDLKARMAASDILREIVITTESKVNQYENNKKLISNSYIEHL